LGLQKLLRNLLRHRRQKILAHLFYRQNYQRYLALLCQNREMYYLEQRLPQSHQNCQKIDYSMLHRHRHQPQ
jgi:hypothetical protein